MDKEAVVPFPGQLPAELFEIFEQLNFFRQGFTMPSLMYIRLVVMYISIIVYLINMMIYM